MFIIAEIAQAHDGSLGLAHSYIDALAETGVDAVKFQTHIADAESSEYEQFRVNFSYEDNTRFDYWKRMEFTFEQWQGLKTHCEEKGMEFISSPFSIAAVEMLEKLGVKKYKIGSGEISNWLMLEKIAKTGKPILLSSGMSDLKELDNTIEFIKQYNTNLALFQCTTAYPTTPEQWGLNSMGVFKNRYNLPIGFSDHSADIFACLAATTLGAQYLEFHVAFHHQIFGPDTKASLTIEQTKNLVKGAKQIYTSLNAEYEKNDIEKYSALKVMFGKSLALKRDVTKGDIILFEDLESKKPGNKGISAKDFQQIIGKKWNRDILKNEFITTQDIS